MRMTINGCLVLLEPIEGQGFCATVGSYGLCSVYGQTELDVLHHVAFLLTED